MRTIEDLDEDLKKRALRNHDVWMNDIIPYDIAKEISVYSAFNWMDSPEGYHFWEHVYYSEEIDKTELIKLLLK